MGYRGKSLEEWQPLIREWQASGLSMTRWCKERQLPLHLFCYWKEKIDRTKPSGQFVLLKEESRESSIWRISSGGRAFS